MRNLLTTLMAMAILCLPMGFLQAQDWVWSTALGGVDDDNAHAVTTDTLGNVYVTGNFSGTADFGAITLTSAGDSDLFLVKFNADGIVQWATSAGGTGTDTGKDVHLDSDGIIYVTGEFSGTASFGTIDLIALGSTDVYLAKFDTNGTVLDAVAAYATANEDESSKVRVNDNTTVYVGGQYDAGGGFNDVFLVQHQAASLLQNWSESFGGGVGFHSTTGLAAANDGDAFLSGQFSGTITIGTSTITATSNSDFYLARYNDDGTVVWVNHVAIAGSAQNGGIDVDAQDNVYMIGDFDFLAHFGTDSLTTTTEREVLYAKFDSDGIVQWLGQSDNAGWMTGEAIAVDESGNSYLGGTIEAFAAFGSLNLFAIGEDDSYAVKIDPDGNPVWGKNIEEIENQGFHRVNDVAVDASGNNYVVGSFDGEIGFDAASLLPVGATDGFLAKIEDSACPLVVSLELTISDISGTSAVANWTADGAEEFQFRYRQLPFGTWSEIITSTANTYTLTDLAPGNQYLFRIRALCDGLVLDNAEVRFNTSEVIACTQAPQNLQVLNITAHSADLSWDAVDPVNLLSYTYRYRMAGGSWVTGTTTSNTLTINGLSPSTTYEFAVRNNCVSGDSPVSRIRFTTESALSMSLVPNPASQQVAITTADIMYIEISDLSGQPVLSTQLKSGANLLDISFLPKGIYIIKGNSTQGLITKRLIKN